MRSFWQDRKNLSVNEYLGINVFEITCPAQLSIYSLHHLLISSLCHPSEFPAIFYFDAEISIWKVTLVLSSHSFTSLCSKLLAMLWHNLDLILCVLASFKVGQSLFRIFPRWYLPKSFPWLSWTHLMCRSYLLKPANRIFRKIKIGDFVRADCKPAICHRVTGIFVR